MGERGSYKGLCHSHKKPRGREGSGVQAVISAVAVELPREEAEAALRISLARRSSLTSRSRSCIAGVHRSSIRGDVRYRVRPGAVTGEGSRDSGRTSLRSNRSPSTARGYSCSCSKTSRTVRPRVSGGYLPSWHGSILQHQEPPLPGRFTNSSVGDRICRCRCRFGEELTSPTTEANYGGRRSPVAC